MCFGCPMGESTAWTGSGDAGPLLACEVIGHTPSVQVTTAFKSRELTILATQLKSGADEIRLLMGASLARHAALRLGSPALALTLSRRMTLYEAEKVIPRLLAGRARSDSVPSTGEGDLGPGMGAMSPPGPVDVSAGNTTQQKPVNDPSAAGPNEPAEGAAVTEARGSSPATYLSEVT